MPESRTPLRLPHALRTALLFGLLIAFGSSSSARDKDDHERVRKAVQEGQVMPLESLLQHVQRQQPGQVLEIELERDADLWIYEVKLLDPNGRLVKLKLDARSADVLSHNRQTKHHTTPYPRH